MWKPEHRQAADRSDLRYPSDLTDAEWAIVEPMIPVCTETPCGRSNPICGSTASKLHAMSQSGRETQAVASGPAIQVQSSRLWCPRDASRDCCFRAICRPTDLALALSRSSSGSRRGPGR